MDSIGHNTVRFIFADGSWEIDEDELQPAEHALLLLAWHSNTIPRPAFVSLRLLDGQLCYRIIYCKLDVANDYRDGQRSNEMAGLGWFPLHLGIFFDGSLSGWTDWTDWTDWTGWRSVKPLSSPVSLIYVTTVVTALFVSSLVFRVHPQSELWMFHFINQ